MNSRIATTPIVRNLFCNVPIESGMTDADIVHTYGPNIPHKTFSRMRIRTPETITLEQFLLIARLTEAKTGIDSSKLFAHLRQPHGPVDPQLKTTASAGVFARSGKEYRKASQMCDQLVRSSQSVHLFDRDNSFACLLPASEESLTASVECDDGVMNHAATPAPTVSITLTLSSLAVRYEKLGNEGIESLIDVIERDAHRLTIVDDSKRNQPRTRGGIFHDAKAVAIVDRQAMFVLPDHGRAVRSYSANQNPSHAEIIDSAFCQLARIHLFKVHTDNRDDMIDYLKSHLSYRLPSPQ